MGNAAASAPSLTFTFAIISRTEGRRTASSEKGARATPPSIRAAARQYSRLNFPSSPVAGGSPRSGSSGPRAASPLNPPPPRAPAPPPQEAARPGGRLPALALQSKRVGGEAARRQLCRHHTVAGGPAGVQRLGHRPEVLLQAARPRGGGGPRPPR